MCPKYAYAFHTVFQLAISYILLSFHSGSVLLGPSLEPINNASKMSNIDHISWTGNRPQAAIVTPKKSGHPMKQKQNIQQMIPL